MKKGWKEGNADYLKGLRESNAKAKADPTDPEAAQKRKEHFDSYEEDLNKNLASLEEQLPVGYRARIVAGEEMPGYGKGEDALLAKLVDEGTISQDLADDILEKRALLSAHQKMKTMPDEIDKLIADAQTITARLTDMGEQGARDNDAYNKLVEDRDALVRNANDYRNEHLTNIMMLY